MILVALGANLASAYGMPEDGLVKARQILEEEHNVRVSAFSSIWVSAPVPISDQPWYRNAVMAVETSKAPEKLLAVLNAIEHEFGRDRAFENKRNAARAMDLDILAYHDRIFTDPALLIPHPRMHKRQFVLEPLCEIAAGFIHPVLNKKIEDL